MLGTVRGTVTLILLVIVGGGGIVVSMSYGLQKIKNYNHIQEMKRSQAKFKKQESYYFNKRRHNNFG